MTADEFYKKARMVRRKTGWRYGQALFNTLLEVRPDLAEQVRGTDKDPFFSYGGIGDPRLYAFGDFINENWNKP
jgi:hypothetical protein